MTLAEQIERLTRLSASELQAEWRRVYRGAPPQAYTADLLLRGIAYRMQEKALGGLPRDLRHELDVRASIGVKPAKPLKTQAVRLKPGNRLVRRWRGTTYAVMVTDTGFLFEGRSYTSLSTIASEITGTRWSGPRFFGLTRAGA